MVPVAAFFIVASACAGPSTNDADAPVLDADALVFDGDSDRSDDGGVIRSSSWTQVAMKVALTDERLCDLDDDGSPDNAFADLGESQSNLATMVFSSYFQARYDLEIARLIMHCPWIEDLDTPHDVDINLLMFSGEDVENPDDRSNDFSGHEPFYAAPTNLDPCGEPNFAIRAARIDTGELWGATERALLPMTDRPLPIQRASLMGSIEPGGGSAELLMCGYVSARDLGNANLRDFDDGSLLELLLSGGSILGIPSIPGLVPNVDADNDGLERILLDEQNRVELCVDGDSTVLRGRDCWQREGMADGFGLVAAVSTVSASFAGREPGWENEVEGSCDAPPETSLWDTR